MGPVVLTMLIALATGCDLFDARDPEAPDGARGSWDVPRLPDEVLTNLSLALFERNAANYMRSFAADSFQFIADPVVVQQQPDLAAWDYGREQTFINSLFGEGVLGQDGDGSAALNHGGGKLPFPRECFRFRDEGVGRVQAGVSGNDAGSVIENALQILQFLREWIELAGGGEFVASPAQIAAGRECFA